MTIARNSQETDEREPVTFNSDASGHLDATTRRDLRHFSPYRAYRESGEWFGTIPAHWDIAPVYARYEVALGKMLDEKRFTGQMPGPYVRNLNVQWDRVDVDDLPEMDFTAAERERYRLREGDLLICEGGEVGRTAIWRGELAECFYQKAVHRVRPHDKNEVPRFLYYTMYSIAKRGVFVARGNSNTIDHLTAVQLKHYRFPFPPHLEQRAIAALLDRQTGEIDALIAKARRLTELLQQKRSVLLECAITEGVDQSVPVRPTVAALFPDIPADWQMIKLRRLLARVTRPVRVELAGEYREIGTRSWGKGIFHKEPVTGAHLEEKSVFYVEPGDLILNIVFAWEGAVAVASEREKGMIASHRFPTFRHAAHLVDLDYVLMFLQSEHGRALMGLNSPGAAGRNRTIRLESFLNEEIPLPPLHIQREIVKTFRAKEQVFSAAEAKSRALVERLREFRTALVSAAVTGKIDVRSGRVPAPVLTGAAPV